MEQLQQMASQTSITDAAKRCAMINIYGGKTTRLGKPISSLRNTINLGRATQKAGHNIEHVLYGLTKNLHESLVGDLPIPAAKEMPEKSQEAYKALKRKAQKMLVQEKWYAHICSTVDTSLISTIASKLAKQEHHALFTHQTPEIDNQYDRLLSQCPRKDFTEFARMFNFIMLKLPTDIKGMPISPYEYSFLPARNYEIHREHPTPQ